MPPSILIVDDDSFTRKLFDGLLGPKGHVLTFAASGAQARQLFDTGEYNLVIMDQRLPGGDNGLDIVKEMRTRRPRQLALLVTGHANVREAVQAVREGLFDYLTKPFDNLDELEAVIDKALEVDRAYREIDALRRSLNAREHRPAVVGRSPAITTLLRQVEQVAPLDTTVLIEGESGTGKELIARGLHELGPRAGKRFLEINCGAVAESLLEGTLFGYERGAFTGAVRAAPGCFEEADGGTLFLDEIADMSPKLQSSLLRVLQQRSFARLGSSVQRQSDFRLVCATNRPLEEEVRSGRFREDLYYRINVVALRVPPLRARSGDVVLLAAHFLDRYNQRFGKAVGPFSPDAIAALEASPWPGNVRQLENTIERMVALKVDGIVTVADLGLSQTVPTEADEPGLTDYAAARERFEKNYFKQLLHAAGGNMSEAARLSGIARQNLYVRMKRCGIVIDK